MADIIKVIAQSSPPATTLTDLYTVPALTSTVISSVIVCNRGTVATTFRISVAIAGAGDTPAQYLYYDVPISKNNTFVATIGLSLATTDKIRIYAGNANLSFNLAGVEMT
jgi:hypothetical protein